MSDLASRITSPEASAAPNQDMGDVQTAQNDGAGMVGGGSGLQEVNYDVEVSLNELQRDSSNPLGSAQSFEELGL